MLALMSSRAARRVYLSGFGCCFYLPGILLALFINNLAHTRSISYSNSASQQTESAAATMQLLTTLFLALSLSISALAASDAKLTARDAYLAGFQSGYHSQPLPRSLESMHGSPLERRGFGGEATLENFHGGAGYGFADKLNSLFSSKAKKTKDYLKHAQQVQPRY